MTDVHVRAGGCPAGLSSFARDRFGRQRANTNARFARPVQIGMIIPRGPQRALKPV
jgi:hypothetical protein